MEVIQNNKGGDKLSCNGYMYTKKNVNRTTIRWECTRRRGLSCNGKVITDKDIHHVVATLPHNHEPPTIESAEEAQARLTRREKRRRRRQNKGNTTQEGLDSWTTGTGISCLIESLEGCSSTAAPTTPAISSIRVPVPEESPSFSSSSTKSPTPFKKAYVEPEHADGILKSLSWLWRTNKLCDAVICSGDTKIMLHRLILFAVSPHLLEKNIRDGAELEVNLPPGINDEALATFVAFLYDGVLNLTEYNYKDIERVGNLLKVEKVQRYCREFYSSLAEYKLHQQLPMSMPLTMESCGQEHIGKRKRGRPSKQTVVLNLGDEHSLGDRLDPSHYLQSGELSSYQSMALTGATASAISRIHTGSEMPVVFPDSQEYCLPSTSQNTQLFSASQGHVKTEPYQHSPEFNSAAQFDQKTTKDKESTDQISSYLSQDGKSSVTDIHGNSSGENTTSNSDCSTTTIANNNISYGRDTKHSPNPAGADQHSSAKNIGSKSFNKPLSPGSSKDLISTEVPQTSGSSPYPVSLVPTSGDTFSLYSLASS